MLQLQQQEPAFADLAVQIVVVAFESARVVRAYVGETNVTWPILIDDQRTLYHQYEMRRGRLRDISGLRTWWAYAKEFARGRLPRYFGGDVRQLGGDVLVDPAGIVRFHHVGIGPAARPPVATILAARQGQPSGGPPRSFLD